MKILQKIKEWKLNRPESQWSKKKLAIAGAALVVAVGLVIGCLLYTSPSPRDS